MELDSKIKIFESGTSTGVFSRNKKFYPPYFTEKEIKEQFLEVKKRCGEQFGFDSNKIFQAYQKTDSNNIEYPDGKYVILSEEHMQKEDYWEEKIETDILILQEKYKGVVLGNQMADCPILIVEDRKKGVTALSHCGASYIDRKLPIQTVEALVKEFNSEIDDLYVYIGSCIKSNHYIYDKYPFWAKDKTIWKNNIIKKDDGFHIDMNGAIRKQLNSINIKHITESNIDTYSDERYYSHAASSRGIKDKLGQNFVGFFYK